MRAIVCNQWGTPDDLVYEQVASPSPGPGELHLRVNAAGVNFADSLIIAGKYQVRPPLPFSPGLEMAGVVIEAGEGVTGFSPGDRVAAVASYGGYAEEAVVSAATAVPIPENMDDVTAAGFLVAHGTSHIALTHRAQLEPGEVLLVHGASGGVGITAVEIGKQLGATVIASAGSDEKLELPDAYGADHLINYREIDFRERVLEITEGRGADVIYDPVGGRVFDQSLRTLAWCGRLLVIGFASGRIPEAKANYLLVKNISLLGVHWGAYAQRQPEVMGASFAQLMQWYAEGRLKPHVSQTLPLADAPAALGLLLERKSTGKVVLTPGGSSS